MLRKDDELRIWDGRHRLDWPSLWPALPYYSPQIRILEPKLLPGSRVISAEVVLHLNSLNAQDIVVRAVVELKSIRDVFVAFSTVDATSNIDIVPQTATHMAVTFRDQARSDDPLVWPDFIYLNILQSDTAWLHSTRNYYVWIFEVGNGTVQKAILKHWLSVLHFDRSASVIKTIEFDPRATSVEPIGEKSVTYLDQRTL